MTGMTETLKHIRRVQGLLGDLACNLVRRAELHDASKLESPEAEVFEEFTGKLRDTTYGSEKYKGLLAAMKPALDHHYAENSHHPEHYRWHCPVCQLQIGKADWEDAPQGPNDSGVRYCPQCCRYGMLYESELMDKPELGIRGMNLIDIVEMLADWKAATERHADGDLLKSIELNQKRFGYTDELKTILTNTARVMGWL